MDKVFIKDLRVQGILGIHEWERVTPREIVINVTLYADTRRAARTDDIADCVDYSAMAKKRWQKRSAPTRRARRG